VQRHMDERVNAVLEHDRKEKSKRKILKA
jgi:hypothetical protein